MIYGGPLRQPQTIRAKHHKLSRAKRSWSDRVRYKPPFIIHPFAFVVVLLYALTRYIEELRIRFVFFVFYCGQFYQYTSGLHYWYWGNHKMIAVVPMKRGSMVQWNLSVTTTSIINFITRDLFSNMFWTISICKEQEDGNLIIPMALAHPLLPINSRSRNKRRNLWVGWCVSSWWP